MRDQMNILIVGGVGYSFILRNPFLRWTPPQLSPASLSTAWATSSLTNTLSLSSRRKKIFRNFGRRGPSRVIRQRGSWGLRTACAGVLVREWGVLRIMSREDGTRIERESNQKLQPNVALIRDQIESSSESNHTDIGS